MEAVLKKIYALQKANEEIIQRLESVREVVTYDYWIQYDKNGLAKLNEDVQTQKVSSITAAHKPELKFKTDIWDVFNDKLAWFAKSWDDLKRLNALIHSIVEKFELLDKSNKKVALELEKYLHNLAEIQQSLGVVEGKTLSQRSRKAELEAKLLDINSKLKDLFADGVNSSPIFRDFDGSTILQLDHKVKLIEWYGKGWRLLYKASRDGWRAGKFHSMCDNKGKTITVVAHSGHYLIGGFASTSWTSSNNYQNAPGSSLFSLKNQVGLLPTKFELQPGNDGYAMYCHASSGPSFGGGPELVISDKANTAQSTCNFPSGYIDTTGYGRSALCGSSSWVATEIEVFYLPN